jgi:hypothetical protein
MKLFLTLTFFCASILANAAGKDSTINYSLPDSVKAIQFMAEVTVKNMNRPKRFRAGISTNVGQLYLSEYKGKRSISFEMHELSRTSSTGINVKDVGFGSFYYAYNWQEGKTYKLMIAIAFDSAAQRCLSSAYFFHPEENKWKFIGTRRHAFYRNKLEDLAVFTDGHKKSTGSVIAGDTWCQRMNGSWKNLKDGNASPPVINYYGHADSVMQRQTDDKIIADSIAKGKTDAVKNIDGVYYAIMKEGTGRQVAVTDTVVAFYKGYLFTNGEVFDQTKEKPATFPLNRLIKAWQLGLPLIKAGGKIKLVIPSDLAYSIRTRSAKIPPNSILVFEIEVVETKAAQ